MIKSFLHFLEIISTLFIEHIFQDTDFFIYIFNFFARLKTTWGQELNLLLLLNDPI